MLSRTGRICLCKISVYECCGLHLFETAPSGLVVHLVKLYYYHCCCCIVESLYTTKNRHGLLVCPTLTMLTGRSLSADWKWKHTYPQFMCRFVLLLLQHALPSVVVVCLYYWWRGLLSSTHLNKTASTDEAGEVAPRRGARSSHPISSWSRSPFCFLGVRCCCVRLSPCL